jgi:hypothetical protein
LKTYLTAGENTYEFVYNERDRSHSFKIVADFFKPGLSAERQTKKPYHEVGQKMKPDDVRYIILGGKITECDFRELKALFKKVHWIHMEDGSVLWRDSNCNIDTIRMYIDNTKYKKCDIKILVEHDRTL